MQTASVGRLALTVTRIGMGGAPLGGLFAAVSDETALAALEAAWGAGIRYFDTAPLYGFGLAEQRLGAFLRTKPRDAYVVSTKVGRVLRPTLGGPDTSGSLGAFVGALPNDAIFDFSADAVRRSFQSSLDRLGLDRVDIVYLHDPDDHYEAALEQAYPVLHALRASGAVRAIGAGMNQWEMLERFVRTCDLDVILLAGRYTLLDRSAAVSLLPACIQRGVAVMAAGVFNSGILAHDDPAPDAMYNYGAVPEVILQRARLLGGACARHDVPLAAAAIQFPLRHPVVAGAILGMRDAFEVNANVAFAELPIPRALWDELDEIQA